MKSLIVRLKTEPTVILQLLKALLGLLVGAGLLKINDTQSSAVLGVVSAILYLALALLVRQFKWPLVTGLVESVLLLVLAYGYDVSTEVQGQVLLVTSLIGVLLRQVVTPEVKLAPLTPVVAAVPDPGGELY